MILTLVFSDICQFSFQFFSLNLRVQTHKTYDMKKNVGNIDRIVRIIIAIIIASLYFAQVINGTLAIVLLIIGGILVLTSFLSICPLYMIFGINSCKKKD